MGSYRSLCSIIALLLVGLYLWNTAGAYAVVLFSPNDAIDVHASPRDQNSLIYNGSFFPYTLYKKLDPRLLNISYISHILSLESSLNLSTPHRFIVKVIGSDPGRCFNDLEERGLEVYHWFRDAGLAILTIPRYGSPEEVMALAIKLAGLPCVERIWLDNPMRVSIVDSLVLTGVLTLRDSLGANGSGIRIAILDTGVDTSNPNLADSIYAWRDFIYGKSSPYDDNGHGTMVAGIIASRGSTRLGNGSRVWHSINYDMSGEFNYAGPANLTYAINVTLYRGSYINISYSHIYWMESGRDYGVVLVRFDSTAGWVQIARYTGSMLALSRAYHKLLVPSNASIMYLSFIYLSDVANQLGGWWVDDIVVSASSDPMAIIFSDDVEGEMPKEVITSYLWLRTSSRIEGIAPGAQLMVAKVCTSYGVCPESSIMLGIEWAVLGPDGVPNSGDEAHIISISLSAPASTYDPVMQMVDWAYSRGVIVVVSAGNSGPGYETIESPSAARGAISVAASTKVNTTAPFSSWGPSPIDYSLKPDLTAYGMYIVTTAPSGSPYPFAVVSGTSFSAPIVAGLAALIKQLHPSWGPEEVRAALVSTSDTHLYPSMVTNYTMNPYIEGGGIPSVSRAIETRFLPVPAIISFNITEGLNLVTSRPKNILASVSLISYGAPLGVIVEEVTLYRVDKANFSSWVVMPRRGDRFTTNSSMGVSIYVPADASPGYYWGSITLLVEETGRRYRVLYGFKVSEDIRIYGRIIDLMRGSPIGGAVVQAVSSDFTRIYSAAYSDALGFYELRVPRSSVVRITANASSYYQYISTELVFNSDSRYDIAMTPRYGHIRGQALVVVDKAYGFFPFTRFYPDASSLLSHNGSTGIVMRLWDNSIQGLASQAILSGDFDIIVWMSGGIFTPIMDVRDADALIKISQTRGKTIVLEGGDIGWWHRDDDLMRLVAHAIFDKDMTPGTYSLRAVVDHMVLRNISDIITVSTGLDARVVAWPDSVIPWGGGRSIAKWIENDLNYCIVVFENHIAARTLYFTFPLSDISDADLQRSIIANIVSWAILPVRESAPVGGYLVFDRSVVPLATNPAISARGDSYNLLETLGIASFIAFMVAIAIALRAHKEERE